MIFGGLKWGWVDLKGEEMVTYKVFFFLCLVALCSLSLGSGSFLAFHRGFKRVGMRMFFFALRIDRSWLVAFCSWKNINSSQV